MAELVREERVQLIEPHAIDDDVDRVAIRPAEDHERLSFSLRLLRCYEGVRAVTADGSAARWGLRRRFVDRPARARTRASR